jgi:hypothetical protein
MAVTSDMTELLAHSSVESLDSKEGWKSAS